MLLTWCSAVFVLMNRRAAISAFDSPSPISAEDLALALGEQSEVFGPVRAGPPSSRTNAAARSGLAGAHRRASNAVERRRAPHRAPPRVARPRGLGELEAGSCRLERQLELPEPVVRLVRRTRRPARCGLVASPALGEACERRDHRVPRVLGGRAELGDGRARRLEIPSRELDFDEPREQRRAEHPVASDGVQAPQQPGRRQRGLAPAPGRDRPPACIASGSPSRPSRSAASLLEPALQHADLGELDRRIDASGPVSPGAERSDRAQQLSFGVLATAGRGEHLRVAGPAEREKGKVAALLHETLDDPRPLLEPAGIARELARRIRGCSTPRRRSRACRPRPRSRRPSPRRGGPVPPRPGPTGSRPARARPARRPRGPTLPAPCPSSSAARARRSRSAGSSARRPRAISSQPRSGLGLAQEPLGSREPSVRRGLVAVHRQVFARQPDGHVPARTGSVSLYWTNARSRCSIAPSGSPSHHSARPSPSCAIGPSSSASATSNAARAPSQSPARAQPRLATALRWPRS